MATCYKCRQEMIQGWTELKFDEHGQSIMVKNVPAFICACGESQVKGSIAKYINNLINVSKRGSRMFKVTSCAICGGEVTDITVKYFERYMADVGMVIFEDIPSQQCLKCGEKFYPGEILKKIDKILDKKIKSHKMVKIDVSAYSYNEYLLKTV